MFILTFMITLVYLIGGVIRVNNEESEIFEAQTYAFIPFLLNLFSVICFYVLNAMSAENMEISMKRNNDYSRLKMLKSCLTTILYRKKNSTSRKEKY